MAKKISLVNMKGGVGKSTLAAQLAYEFAIILEWSKKVLVVDLDPQFNVSQFLVGATTYKSEILDKNAPTTWHIFEQNTHVPDILHLNLSTQIRSYTMLRVIRKAV
jgi:chromosome partitioning protein